DVAMNNADRAADFSRYSANRQALGTQLLDSDALLIGTFNEHFAGFGSPSLSSSYRHSSTFCQLACCLSITWIACINARHCSSKVYVPPHGVFFLIACRLCVLWRLGWW